VVCGDAKGEAAAGLDATDAEGGAAALFEPPQAATARPATTTSSADAQNTIAGDLRFP
jgi:hypothetical protein